MNGYFWQLMQQTGIRNQTTAVSPAPPQPPLIVKEETQTISPAGPSPPPELPAAVPKTQSHNLPSDHPTTQPHLAEENHVHEVVQTRPFLPPSAHHTPADSVPDQTAVSPPALTPTPPPAASDEPAPPHPTAQITRPGDDESGHFTRILKQTRIWVAATPAPGEVTSPQPFAADKLIPVTPDHPNCPPAHSTPTAIQPTPSVSEQMAAQPPLLENQDFYLSIGDINLTIEAPTTGSHHTQRPPQKRDNPTPTQNGRSRRWQRHYLRSR